MGLFSGFRFFKTLPSWPAFIERRAGMAGSRAGQVFLKIFVLCLVYSSLVGRADTLPPEISTETNSEDSIVPLEPVLPSESPPTDEMLNSVEYADLVALPDPNVDSMPPLDDQEIELVDLPPEADDRMWRIRPIIAAGVTYDDNIFITNTNRIGDMIYNIDLGFSFDLGDYRNRSENFLTLQYLASGIFFGKYTSQNSFDQQGSFLGQYRFEHLSVQLDSTYQYLNGAQRQVGSFTTRTLFNNKLRFLYPYSTKTDLDFELRQMANYYPQNLSSFFYEASTGFNYELFPKTKIGLQGILGYADVQDSPDMWYQTLNTRASYLLTGKVAVKSSLGLQFNQYVSGGEPMRIIPVFSVGADYALLSKTNLRLLAYRNLQASPSIEGQDYIATGGEIGIDQNFSEKLVFGISSGYENDTYVANTEATDATRVDNFFYFRPKISYSFMKYVRSSVSYEYRANDSTLQQDSWFDNRWNFEVSSDF
jgi:hypothetical protein